MIKLKKTVSFNPNSNRMRIVADIKKAIEDFENNLNPNLNFLLIKRYSWMKKFILNNDKGLEVGAGAGQTVSINFLWLKKSETKLSMNLNLNFFD